LQTGIDENDVRADIDDAAGQDGTWLDLLGGQAFFEQLRTTFGHEGFWCRAATRYPLRPSRRTRGRQSTRPCCAEPKFKDSASWRMVGHVNARRALAPVPRHQPPV